MYTLVINNKVEVGPREWKYAIFAKYLLDNKIDYANLPKVAPKEPVITDNWSILPVETVNKPTYDAIYEQLSGPELIIEEDNTVTINYVVVPNSVSVVKSKLKQQVTDDRYKVETGGINFTFADNTEIKLYTSREDRNTYLDALLTVPDGVNVTFKFQGGIFKSVTKTELQSIVNTIVTHVQSAFEWENTKHEELELCETLEELKLVDIIHPLLVSTETTEQV